MPTPRRASASRPRVVEAPAPPPPPGSPPAGRTGTGGSGGQVPPELLEAKKILLAQLGGLGACIQARLSGSPPPGQVGVGNIHGVGIGFKLRDGYETGELAVIVTVDRKVSDRGRVVDEQAIIPAFITVGDKKVPTDVVAMKPFEAHVAYGAPEKPAHPGTSISPAGKATGTFGAVVWVNKGTADDPLVIPCILSNAHVMALDDRGGPLGPKGIDGVDGLPIVQPGAADPTDPSKITQIGYLYNYSLLSLATSNDPRVVPSSFVDAAIAWTNFDLVSPKHHTYELNTNLDQAGTLLHMTVKKEGRTTGLTTGTVTSVFYDGVVGYGPNGGAPFAHFTDSAVIEGVGGRVFSDHGDSGSLVVESMSNIPVALLLGGNGQQTFANPITDVMQALNIRAFVNSQNQSGPD